MRLLIIFLIIYASLSPGVYADKIRKTVSVDDAFLEAMSLRELGRENESDIVFQSLIESKKDPIILLEIARVYYRERRYEEANSIFRLVRKDFDLPLVTLEKVNSYIIKSAEADWLTSYEWSFSQTQNPNRNARSGEYIIFGMPLQYVNNEAKSYLGFNQSIKTGGRLGNSWDALITLEVQDYENREADTAGASINVDDHERASPFFKGFSAAHQSGSLFKESVFGPLIGFDKTIGEANITSKLSLSKVTNTNSSGNQLVLKSWLYNPLGVKNSRIEWSHLKQSFVNKIYSNQTNSFLLSKKAIFTNFTISPSLLLANTKFKMVDPFWNKKRIDTISRPSLELCFKAIVFPKDQLVCFSVAKEIRKSNISFYEYKEDIFNLSFSHLL